jgi:hypothetical protein
LRAADSAAVFAGVAAFGLPVPFADGAVPTVGLPVPFANLVMAAVSLTVPFAGLRAPFADLAVAVGRRATGLAAGARRADEGEARRLVTGRAVVRVAVAGVRFVAEAAFFFDTVFFDTVAGRAAERGRVDFLRAAFFAASVRVVLFLTAAFLGVVLAAFLTAAALAVARARGDAAPRPRLAAPRERADVAVRAGFRLAMGGILSKWCPSRPTRARDGAGHFLDCQR